MNDCLMSLDQYLVQDLHSSDNENVIILVLESPHNQEYKRGYPAAGQAGMRLLELLRKSGVLYKGNDNEPLGSQINQGTIKSIAIINSSQLPLDSNFYTINNAFVHKLDSVKKRLEKRTQVKYIPKEGLETKIFNDFSNRLKASISDSTKMIIPLGHLASNFVKSTKGIECAIHYGVKHPSCLSWNSPENLKEFNQAISPLITNQSSRPPSASAD